MAAAIGAGLPAAAPLVVGASVAGCHKAPSPAEQVGDSFVDAYLRADQDGALRSAALTAETQLKKELSDVKAARIDSPPDAHASWKRVGEEMRDKRTVLKYEVSVDKGASTRTMHVEVLDLGQGPKVVLYELQ